MIFSFLSAVPGLDVFFVMLILYTFYKLRFPSLAKKIQRALYRIFANILFQLRALNDDSPGVGYLNSCETAPHQMGHVSLTPARVMWSST